MQKLKGRLGFLGWFNLPWTLITDDGNIDLWPFVDKFALSLNGKPANHNCENGGYALSVDDSSEFVFKYIPGELIILEKLVGFGFSNVQAYLEEALVWLSGRKVKIEIENGKQIKFIADKTEKVYGVYFTGEDNSCEVPSGIEKTVCKIGQPDCCVFLSASGSGFFCEKFTGPVARVFLDRLAKNNLRAKRIGSCAILGRKE